MDRLGLELRQTWRTIRGRVGSSLSIVAILALGLGLTAAMFALADPYLTRALPYSRPADLVTLHVRRTANSDSQIGRAPQLRDWQARTDLFSDVAAYGDLEWLRIPSPDGIVRLTVRRVSPNFLSVLGVGATSVANVAALEAHKLLLLDPRATATEVLSGDAARTLHSDQGEPLQMTTLPAQFTFPSPLISSRPDALTPAEFSAMVTEDSRGRIAVQWSGIARLAPGVTPAAVHAALGGSASSLGFRLDVERLNDVMTAGVRSTASGALIAGLLIVLASIANVANLVISRAVYRTPEFATRLSLGATHRDVFRLVLLDLVAVAAAGFLGALTLSRILIAAMSRVIPDQYLTVGAAEVTWRVDAFTLMLVVVVITACVYPAWFTVRSGLKALFRRVQARESRGVSRFRFFMIASQTASAMVLLIGASLLLRSYAKLWSQDTGFGNDARIVSVSYLGAGARASHDSALAIAAALRSVPGIVDAVPAVGVGALLDNLGTVGGQSYEVAGRTFLMTASEVGTAYFGIMGTRLLAGRALTSGDVGSASLVVNHEFARQVWPGLPIQDVIGKTLVANHELATIVGVVENARDRALDLPAVVRVYKPFEIRQGAVMLSFAIKPASPAPSNEAIRRAIARADPRAFVEGIDAVDSRLADSVNDRSFATLILTSFATAGLGVTSVGLFAAVAFVVARRTREIAIRVAVGAEARHVRRFVLQNTAVAAFAGAAVGMGAGRLFAKTLDSQLYGIESGDLASLGAAVLLLTILAILAAWVPTRRALKVDPNRALRSD